MSTTPSCAAPPGFSPQRRRLLTASALALSGAVTVDFAAAHANVGPVDSPVNAPALPLVRHDRARTTLAAQLAGSVTVVQLMFTGCSAICPVQGALFASLQDTLDARRAGPVRLLSLSIDPLGDDPKALTAWLQRFGAGPRWSAAAPVPEQLDRMLAIFRGATGGSDADRHTTQVHLFDRQARSVWRTSELPSITEIGNALARVQG